MFPKDRDRTKPSPTRPLAPKLAANSAFVRSPPAAPRLAAPFSSSSPSHGYSRSSPFTSAKPSNSPSSTTPLNPNVPAKSAGTTSDDGGTSGVINGTNITPRSAARRSKLSSASSTPRASTSKPDVNPRSPNLSARNPPNVLAALSSPAPLKTKSSPATPTGRNGSKDLGLRQRAVPAARSQVSPTPLRQAPGSRDADIGNSFFHASEPPPQSPPRKPALPKQASSFVYANGQRNVSQEDPPSEVASVQDHPSQSSPPIDSIQSFVQIGTTSPPFKLNGSPPSAFHRPTSSSSAPVAMQVYNSFSPKPLSPPKHDFHLSYRKGASQIIRPPESQPQLPDTALSDIRMRQASLDTVSESFDPNPDFARARAPSVSSQSLSGAPVVSPSAPEPTDTSNSQASLAARARQERKVLDLEISNSSLLAINRSLEREVRRQKVEIRRYRRLSRNSTRISWLSDATTPDPLDDDIIEESDENSASDTGLDDVTDPDSVPEGTLSPATLAKRDEKFLRGDEKRLQLDLSKHKQLLVDSQKMNGSLKRCLGLSEQLIKDAGRALEYKVDVTDTRLGGRVLSPEEVEPDPESERQSETYFYSKWRSENDRLSAASQRLLSDWDVGTDQDSGVDLEYSKHSRES